MISISSPRRPFRKEQGIFIVVSKILTLLLFILGVRDALAQFGRELPKASYARAMGRDFYVIRGLTLDLESKYPRNKHLFVGLGRSPTPIIAMLQALYGEAVAMNIPLSDMRLLQPSEDDYTIENIERFCNHIKRFIPVTNVDQKILFVDWSNTGRTAINFVRESARCNFKFDFEFLAFTHAPKMKVRLATHGVSAIVVEGRALDIFDNRMYRDFAEYEQFRVTSRFSQIKLRELEDLRKSFKEWIDYDMWEQNYRRHPESFVARADFYQIDELYREVMSYDELKAGYREKLSSSWLKRSLKTCERWLVP